MICQRRQKGTRRISIKRGSRYRDSSEARCQHEVDSKNIRCCHSVSHTLCSIVPALNAQVGNESLTAIPPDPYVYRNGGTTTTFSGYGKEIEVPQMIILFAHVRRVLATNFASDLMGIAIREYKATSPNGLTLSLVLVPTQKLTWGMWSSAFEGMDRFLWQDVLDNSPGVEFSFSMKADAQGEKEVGWGLLKMSQLSPIDSSK